jgi:SAM-dependent methyltransferase
MDDAGLWADYLSCLRRARDASGPVALFDGYRQELAAAGIAPEVVDARLARLSELTLERDDWAAPMYDRIYTFDRPQFSPAPSGFLVRIASDLPAGRALDVATGQGRNAIHLARAGWYVVGFDLSTAGLVSAGGAAVAEGLRLHTVVAACDEFDYGVANWDLVVMTFVPFEVASPRFAARIVEALRPGGVVVVESGAADAGGPRRNPVLIDPDQLRASYSALAEIAYDQSTSTSDWGLRPLPLVRLAARRASRPTPPATLS